MTISSLPTVPTRQDPSTFSERMDAFLAALPVFVSQANALGVDLSGASSILDAVTAIYNATIEVTGALKWVSGTTYAEGNVRWSPIDFLSYRRKTDGAGTTDPSQDTTNWAVLTNTIFNDAVVSRAMFKDCGYTFVDKGSSGSNAQTVDFSAGTHQRVKATGNFTLNFSNWPPTGNFGEVLLELVADGTARTITFPAGTRFIKFDGSYTTTFSDLQVALQSANDAIDWLLCWTRDAGTTLYCKVVR